MCAPVHYVLSVGCAPGTLLKRGLVLGPARCLAMEDMPGVPTHRCLLAASEPSGVYTPAAASSTPKRPRHSAAHPAAAHSSTMCWNAGVLAVPEGLGLGALESSNVTKVASSYMPISKVTHHLTKVSYHLTKLRAFVDSYITFVLKLWFQELKASENPTGGSTCTAAP